MAIGVLAKQGCLSLMCKEMLQIKKQNKTRTTLGPVEFSAVANPLG